MFDVVSPPFARYPLVIRILLMFCMLLFNLALVSIFFLSWVCLTVTFRNDLWEANRVSCIGFGGESCADRADTCVPALAQGRRGRRQFSRQRERVAAHQAHSPARNASARPDSAARGLDGARDRLPRLIPAE